MKTVVKSYAKGDMKSAAKTAKTIQHLAVLALLGLSSSTLLAAGHGQAKQLYLSDVTAPKDFENIHVQKLASDENASDFVVFIKKNVPLHKHVTHSETVYVLEGTGIFQFGDKKINIGPGHYVKIPKGTAHGVTVTSAMPLKVISIQAPEFFGKDRVKIHSK